MQTGENESELGRSRLVANRAGSGAQGYVSRSRRISKACRGHVPASAPSIVGSVVCLGDQTKENSHALFNRPPSDCRGGTQGRQKATDLALLISTTREGIDLLGHRYLGPSAIAVDQGSTADGS